MSLVMGVLWSCYKDTCLDDENFIEIWTFTCFTVFYLGYSIVIHANPGVNEKCKAKPTEGDITPYFKKNVLYWNTVPSYGLVTVKEEYLMSGFTRNALIIMHSFILFTDKPGLSRDWIVSFLNHHLWRQRKFRMEPCNQGTCVSVCRHCTRQNLCDSTFFHHVWLGLFTTISYETSF
jgi:hypothetical protein